VAPVTAPLSGDFLVGDDGAESGTPVDGRVGHVCQATVVDDRPLLARRERGPRAAVGRGPGAAPERGDQLVDGTGAAFGGVVPAVEDLQEDPLRPAVVRGIGGLDAAARIVAEPQPAKLGAVRVDVLAGRDGGVL